MAKVFGEQDLTELQLDSTSIKVHAAVDARGHLARMKLSPGQDGDGPHGRELLAEFQPRQIEHVLADTAYDGDETRERIRQLQAKSCFTPHQNWTTKKRYDKERDKLFQNPVAGTRTTTGRGTRIFPAEGFETSSTSTAIGSSGASAASNNSAASRPVTRNTPENFLGFVWLAALMTDVS